MVVSVKQMYAGDGYAYLLRTTADAQGGVLAVSHMTAYYTEEGTPPGQWLGSGIDGLAGDMAVGDVVTVEQMDALYKQGVDPVTGEKLGQGFKRQASLEQRIARRVNLIPKRVTGDAREQLISKIREEESSRKVSKAVSGFDFTFSPVKSVSALWAVADCGVREQIYEAHRAALADVIDTMERRVV
ncbi:MAG: relaxase domain-containing protein, partial [Actinomycetales bacterium]|nr:relaxase domain-containing protein [Actinomycetales bacterium]